MSIKYLNFSGRKKRSTLDENEVKVEEESEYVFPFIEKIGEMGITNLYKNKNCQQRLFCDMAQYGREQYANEENDTKTPNLIQKMFNVVSQS